MTELAREWMEKAESDLRTADRMGGGARTLRAAFFLCCGGTISR